MRLKDNIKNWLKNFVDDSLSEIVGILSTGLYYTIIIIFFIGVVIITGFLFHIGWDLAGKA